MKLAVFAAGLALSLLLPAVQAEQVKLRVGTEATFAPFEYVDEKTKEFTGFDIDIIKAIAKVQGVEIEISSMSFDGLIPAILTGSLDVGIAGFTITEDRKKRVAFSEPYYDAGLGVIISRELEGKVKSVKDLGGSTICAQIGTSGAMYVQEHIPDATLLQYNTSIETYLEAARGTCKAVVNDKPVHEYYLATTNNKDLIMLPEYITSEQYGIVMNKNDKKVQQIINDGYRKIKEDGTYDAIYHKWFGK